MSEKAKLRSTYFPEFDVFHEAKESVVWEPDQNFKTSQNSCIEEDGHFISKFRHFLRQKRRRRLLTNDPLCRTDFLSMVEIADDRESFGIRFLGCGSPVCFHMQPGRTFLSCFRL